jgi:hypothetical protein
MWLADRRLDAVAKVGAVVLLLWAGALVLWWAGEATTNTGPLPRPDHGWAEYWLNRYQTLLAGVAAIVAAAMTVNAVRTQVEETRALAELQREREEYPRRLPLALSCASRYATECMRTLAPLLNGPVRAVDLAAQLPLFLADLIAPLRDAVRFASLSKRRELADLVKVYKYRIVVCGILTRTLSIIGLSKSCSMLLVSM